MNLATVAFGLVLLAVLTGLSVWARLHARRLKQLATAREAEALAAVLAATAAKKKDKDEPDASIDATAGTPVEKSARPLASEETGKTFPMGLDMRDLSSVSVKELPPIEYVAPTAVRDESDASATDHEDAISQIAAVDGPASSAAPKPKSRRKEARAASAEASAPNVPLRELVLAWYEARGYRAAPASPAVRPIELVLRHREDAARAYAFVVQNEYVTAERITAVIKQSRSIGMKRITLIANVGFDDAAKEIARKKHVRLIDRSTMDAELSALELETVAKIIAVARTRAAAEASAA